MSSGSGMVLSPRSSSIDPSVPFSSHATRIAYSRGHAVVNASTTRPNTRGRSSAETASSIAAASRWARTRIISQRSAPRAPMAAPAAASSVSPIPRPTRPSVAPAATISSGRCPSSATPGLTGERSDESRIAASSSSARTSSGESPRLTAAKAFASAGWNCVPAFRSISASASSSESAGRNGRSEVIASNASARIRK